MSKSNIDYTKARFSHSAAALAQLPNDTGAEVAFVGRSNAGKSSALNAITQQKQLAKISKTPGRTQLINIFCLNEQYRLIDLPGYGYAKVSQSVKQNWQALLQCYLTERNCLHGLILLMDCRHPLKEMDQHMLTWTQHSNVPLHVLLTKADKLAFGAAKTTLLTVQKKLLAYGASVQLFSATQLTGVAEVREQLDQWLI